MIARSRAGMRKSVPANGVAGALYPVARFLRCELLMATPDSLSPVRWSSRISRRCVRCEKVADMLLQSQAKARCCVVYAVGAVLIPAAVTFELRPARSLTTALSPASRTQTRCAACAQPPLCVLAHGNVSVVGVAILFGALLQTIALLAAQSGATPNAIAVAERLPWTPSFTPALEAQRSGESLVSVRSAIAARTASMVA